MNPIRTFAALAVALAAAAAQAAPTNAELKQQVADTERAFAASMAKRDFAGFTALLSEEAVFHSGPKPLRGKESIAGFWKKFYDKPEAPFSWEPDDVEVLDSGTLAYSSGPVRDPKGNVVSRYHSIWRLEAPGKWRIIFDRGSDPCDCKKQEQKQ